MNPRTRLYKTLSILPILSLCTSALASSMDFPKQITEVTPDQKMETSSLLAPGTDIGMWVWRKEQLVDPEKRSALIQFCKKFGITRIFVQVRLVKTNETYELDSADDWADLLSTAQSEDIKVEALDGAGDMGFASNREDTLARLNAVLEFQKQQPDNAKFSGVHYDIEPYVTQRWKSDEKQDVILELLDTLTALKAAVKSADQNMTIAHDIPFWYSNRDEYLIEYNGETKYLDEHIQDLADFIGIMSYRTKMTGSNSTSSIGQEELSYAGDNNGLVYLSLETVPLEETPSITFYGRNPAEFVEAIRSLSTFQQGTPGYGGIFLHTYRTVRPMLEQWDTEQSGKACTSNDTDAT